MPEGLHRNVTLADGSRVVQHYIGWSKTYSEVGWDAPGNWEDVITLAPGAVALDFAQPTADVAVTAHEDKIALTIAGTSFVLPAGHVEALIPALTEAVAKAQAYEPPVVADQALAGP